MPGRPHKPNPPGLRFGLLTTVEPTRGNNLPVRCRCDCGVEKDVRFDHLTRKKNFVVSCGCQRIRNRIKHGYTIGCAGQAQNWPTEYKIWADMRRRCNNPRNKNFHKYGGRGIKICERWNDFANFLADLGPRPSMAHTIDRYPNNDGPYAPDNCRWATIKEQARNKRSNCRIEIDGVTRTAAEWGDVMGIDANRIATRLYGGWDPKDAVLTPVKTRKQSVAA